METCTESRPGLNQSSQRDLNLIDPIVTRARASISLPKGTQQVQYVVPEVLRRRTTGIHNGALQPFVAICGIESVLRNMLECSTR